MAASFPFRPDLWQESAAVAPEAYFQGTEYRVESESTMAYLESIAGEHNLYYLFWRHGIQQAQGDYKNAYLSLLESKEQSDSINTLLYVKSAANAQRTYLENRTLESRINDGRRKRISVYLSLAVLSFLFMLYRGFKRKRKELERECDRMVEIKETLESRLSDMTMEKHKAKFTYLSELYIGIITEIFFKLKRLWK